MGWLVEEEFSLACELLAESCDAGGDRVMLRRAVGAEEANAAMLAGNLLQRATTVLEICDEKPTILELKRLLWYIKVRDGVPAIFARLQTIQPVQTTRAAAEAPPPNPVNDRVIDADNLFLDRLHLREVVTRLMLPAGPCVLKVRGPKNSGKTYTYRLCSYLFLKQQPLYPTKVERGGLDITAAALANTLVNRIMNAPIPLDDLKRLEQETDERRGFFLAEKVLTAAASTPYRWWFIFDDFDHMDRVAAGEAPVPGLPPAPPLRVDTRHFITQLALQIAAHPPYRIKYRMILLNYQSELPSALAGLYEDDPLEPHAVDWSGEAATYLNQIFPQLGLDAALMARIPPEAATVLAADALAGIGVAQPEKILAAVSAALLDMRKDLPDVLREMAHA